MLMTEVKSRLSLRNASYHLLKYIFIFHSVMYGLKFEIRNVNVIAVFSYWSLIFFLFMQWDETESTSATSGSVVPAPDDDDDDDADDDEAVGGMRIERRNQSARR
jgi:hypothetical protein